METTLPIIFMLLMGLSLFIYVIADGFDLGVAILLPNAKPAEQDIMVRAIQPFWDANQTWLVLGVGILLIAFPKAQGIVLGQLYIPVALMLAGLVLRGVAFDFRLKAKAIHQPLWTKIFIVGSWIAALSQGWMLGIYVLGFGNTHHILWQYIFACFIALTLTAFYVLIGAAWLIIKTEHDLQRQAIHWAKITLLPTILGFIGIACATPLMNHEIATKWFGSIWSIFLFLIPLPAVIACIVIYRACSQANQLIKRSYIIYLCTVSIAASAAMGLGYSLFPYIFLGDHRLTIWEAANSTASLAFILVGTAITLPLILGYTLWVHWVFRGKVK